MKVTLLLLLGLFTILHAQAQSAKKPQHVVIINNELSTMEKVEEYGAKGYIKSINKGATEEERSELAKRYGTKIGDKEFIVKILLYTESELLQLKNQATSDTLPRVHSAIDEGYILQVNDTAKNFIVRMVDGTSVDLSSLKGNVVILNFWATWCAPCLMEFYDIPSTILAPFKNERVVLLPISIGEPLEKVLQKKASLAKDGIDFNMGIDPDKSIWKLYATQAIPKNFLIDQDGIIRFVSTGNAEGNLDQLAAEIKKLLSK